MENNKISENNVVNENDEETSQLETNCASLSLTCQAIQEQSASLTNKWSQTFSDSEKYDSFYETRLDELIKDALELEESLVEQKNLLKRKLQGLTKTLALVSES